MDNTETMVPPKQSVAAESVVAYLNVIATALNQITLDLNNQIANINAAINKENDTNESAS